MQSKGSASTRFFRIWPSPDWLDDIRMAIVVEGVAVGHLPPDPADGQVHPGEPPHGVVRLLPVDRDVAARVAAVGVAGGMGADEFDRLHEHARRAAAGIVDPPLVGLQQRDNAPQRAELATPPPHGGLTSSTITETFR